VESQTLDRQAWAMEEYHAKVDDVSMDDVSYQTLIWKALSLKSSEEERARERGSLLWLRERRL
jgi:hypothetical protein